MIDKTEFDKIPKNSSKVIVETTKTPDSLYYYIEKMFSKDGWEVNSNKSAMQISCKPKSIGSGTLLKPLAYIESSAVGSKVYLTGEVGLDKDGQIMMQALANTQVHEMFAAKYTGSATSRSDLGFQKLVVIAKNIGGEIKYE